MTLSSLLIRQVAAADLDRCFAIETLAYEGDEAATREKIATWPDGFIVAEVDGVVAGFINSGAAFEVEMADEAFKELIGHDPAGPHVVIMSVVVHPDYQGQGVSRRLLEAFIERMRGLGKASINLMCKERHVPLYERFGFVYLKASASDHGGMAWHEMVLSLPR
ncbi:GNAT family N-acetyltransferase [Pseudomonas chlororaphis]|uniref:GNAT family N-acetyltransferase n=1 Tax=Pseudomonas chlororaphis TaxID=587753 RepID=UPI0007B327CC|nr:GNAT family N-acetyltransferase [Pseudomonas chlororaphis]AZC65149.1 Acetyltransferase, GNAT family [Pseudomonas chlororaphis subsp. piscium]AZC71390.1 Acetyltransferase, GNAT family [Pseudomonas chlororaphis subsp. piscium]KZO47837.1 GNAT family acetyltransferase [Pseudomonas chlororaphis subsp. piscium]MBP5069143.1 GNAT family N-acetyltransferase [Pseudomonas chlororaphis]UQS89522.1 GNAT family N-acetyltransferase [Pseudomonas chlororaphis subsp. piscium]